MSVCDEKYGEYLAYLYEIASIKYGGDVDELVSESIFAFWCYEKSGKVIEHPKGLLDAILRNKHNDLLREKYRHGTLPLGDALLESAGGSPDDHAEEYAAVRREVGRLLKIYREVVVRFYMHGQSVEQIARELRLPKGTVLSRLSSARGQIKEGLEKMEKYAPVSYEPKEASLGIYGGSGMGNEPFSVISSPIEVNILICAYERPVSLRGLADTLGMPTAYIEPIADKLVKNELLGQTPSGLVYTRCYVEVYEESFGDISYAEELAEKNVRAFADMITRAEARYNGCLSYEQMTEKQRATLLLLQAFTALIAAAAESYKGERVEPDELPVRPNGGRWLATLSYFDKVKTRDLRYDCSGPLTVNYRAPENPSAHCMMKDCQTPFGDAHWGYNRFPKAYSAGSILRFYASFLPSGVKTDRKDLNDMIPEFEKMHILRKDAKGNVVLDLPALTFEEERTYVSPISADLKNELKSAFETGLARLWEHGKRRVPAHVDRAKCFRHERVACTYAVAQMRACIEKGLFPYPVEIGKTPLICVYYEEMK